MVDTVVRAIGGEVAGIEVVVAGPNVAPIDRPVQLSPADGNVVVARRRQQIDGEKLPGTVVVSWVEGDDRNTRVIGW